MLVAHHIIDVLRGAVKRPRFIDMSVLKGNAERVAADIERAQKFDFGELHLEVKEHTQTGPIYTLPELTRDEMGFWRDGLIPLPFDTCWFEFTLNGYRSGFLVKEEGTEWSVLRIDFVTETMVLDGVIISADRVGDNNLDLKISISGNTKLYQKLESDPQGRVTARSMASAVPLVIYFALMLNSKTTEVMRSAPPPAKLNKKRVNRGRAPLDEHRIVTIVPHQFRSGSRNEGTGAGRRLHWRRSHLRHYDHNTPRSKWSPDLVHAGKTGWWVAVIPRHLVGRADLGEITHEYRIANPVPQSETAADL